MGESDAQKVMDHPGVPAPRGPVAVRCRGHSSVFSVRVVPFTQDPRVQVLQPTVPQLLPQDVRYHHNVTQARWRRTVAVTVTRPRASHRVRHVPAVGSPAARLLVTPRPTTHQTAGATSEE